MEIGLMFMANKGPSFIQDWQGDTDHYIMVMNWPFSYMDLFSFIELHEGSFEKGDSTTYYVAGHWYH